MTATRSSTVALKDGQALVRAGKLAAALDAFRSAGETDHPHVLLHHGLALLRAGDGDGAVDQLAAAVAAAPGDVVPAVFHAYVLLRAGRLDEAADALERAQTLSRENPLVPSLEAALDILQGRVADGCRRLLDGPLTDNLGVLSWIVAALERRLFEAVGPDAAAGILPAESNPKDDPPDEAGLNSAEACGRMAENAAESACPRTAAVFAARAVELDPASARWRTLYGGALFDSGRFEDAREQLDAARFRGGDRVERLRTALRHRLRGRPLAGLRAVLLAPVWSWRSFWRDVARTRRRDGVGTFAAISRVRARARDESFARKSYRPLWHLYRAANSYRLGRFDEALATIDAMPAVGDAILYQELRDFIRGMVLVALDRVNEAADHLGRYIDTDLRLVQRRLQRGIEIWEGGDDDEREGAQVERPDAGRTDPPDPDAPPRDEIANRQSSIVNPQSQIPDPKSNRPPEDPPCSTPS
jgi:tetratricopeptide (TPR) repeat protein